MGENQEGQQCPQWKLGSETLNTDTLDSRENPKNTNQGKNNINVERQRHHFFLGKFNDYKGCSYSNKEIHFPFDIKLLHHLQLVFKASLPLSLVTSHTSLPAGRTAHINSETITPGSNMLRSPSEWSCRERVL